MLHLCCLLSRHVRNAPAPAATRLFSNHGLCFLQLNGNEEPNENSIFLRKFMNAPSTATNRDLFLAYNVPFTLGSSGYQPYIQSGMFLGDFATMTTLQMMSHTSLLRVSGDFPEKHILSVNAHLSSAHLINSFSSIPHVPFTATNVPVLQAIFLTGGDETVQWIERGYESDIQAEREVWYALAHANVSLFFIDPFGGTPNVLEESRYNRYNIAKNGAMILECMARQEGIEDTMTVLKVRLDKLEAECNRVFSEIYEKLEVQEEAYQEKLDALAAEYDALKAKYEALKAEKELK